MTVTKGARWPAEVAALAERVQELETQNAALTERLEQLEACVHDAENPEPEAITIPTLT